MAVAGEQAAVIIGSAKWTWRRSAVARCLRWSRTAAGGVGDQDVNCNIDPAGISCAQGASLAFPQCLDTLGIMPASLPADWSAIGTLAASGTTLQELSESFGIKLNTIKARSRRGRWKSAGEEVQLRRVERATEAKQMVPQAVDGVAVVRDTLAECSRDTRLNLAKATGKAAKHAATLEGEAALRVSRAVKETAGAAAIIHGWHREGSQTVRLSMSGPSQPIEIEAEFVQDDPVALVEGLAGTD